MKTRAQKGKWTITLQPECAIADVGNDLGKLRRIPKSVNMMEIDADNAEEMDTAYFQMLLSLRASAAERDIALKLKNRTPLLDEISDLYGLGLES